MPFGFESGGDLKNKAKTTATKGPSPMPFGFESGGDTGIKLKPLSDISVTNAFRL